VIGDTCSACGVKMNVQRFEDETEASFLLTCPRCRRHSYAAGIKPQALLEAERQITAMTQNPAAGYAPLTRDAESSARAILRALMGHETLPAQLFPLRDGGVQIEWHAAGNSIEIEVDEDGVPYATAETAAGTAVAEGDLDGEGDGLERLDTVDQFLDSLSARTKPEAAE
jgi:hypothetical protein